MTREEIRTAGDMHDCEKDGHCLHEGTSIGSLWCCKCRKYILTLAQKLNFYKENWYAK